jgi:hypothetical protein
MNSEVIIHEVRDFLDEYYKGPTSYYTMRRDRFNNLAYFRASCEIIMDELYAHQDENLIIVMKDMWDRVDNYCCEALEKKQNGVAPYQYDMFIDLYTVISNVIDFLYAMGG